MEPPPTDTRISLIVGVTSAAIAVIGIFMALRVYIRGYLMRAWKLDDTMFICSAIIAVAQIALIKCGAIYGALGRHIWTVTIPMVKKDAHFLASAALIYQVAFPLVKATYLTQYRRAFALPDIKLLCDVFLVVLLVVSSALLILGGVAMKGFTDPDPNKLPGYKSTGFLLFNYLTGAFNLVTGILIFMLPIALVGRMRFGAMQKAGLIASFGVGIFTCVMSVMRIISMKMSLTSVDEFYEVVPVTLLGVAELTSASVCACIPLMRPLMSCAGTTGYRGKGSREPLSAELEESASRMRRRHGLPLSSPATSTFPVTPTFPTAPQMARVVDGRESVIWDIESYHESNRLGRTPTA
ncbi:hypothetical protein LX32DRAFT_618749 [Colletotrichum zoysiae]|uniref:Rhodopsin domain-containing protein n=1 Tax=Colletotrichum zoysiae TaxID=1216348 RepID=A0AAD9HGR5_9PEZI|nr:hypothetical protein LX32DRAFT_618749 [Colletotrichum zoysiae]